jgi:hypothetical protein
MKKRNNIRSKAIIGLICILALVLVTLSTHGWADPCADPKGDLDNDGFTNEEECSMMGITIPNFKPFPKCTPSQPRIDCVDPETKDLFVMIYRETDKIPQDSPLEFITNPYNPSSVPPTYGLGIAVHEIPYNDDRHVTSRQNAVSITEMTDNDNDNDPVLGDTQVGTPNDGDNSRVWPQRIINHINAVCTHTDSSCMKSTGVPLAPSKCLDSFTKLRYNDPAFITLYIKHTLAHETAHALNRKQPTSISIGNHYPDTKKVVLSQHVYTKRVHCGQKTEKLTWFIGTKFTPDDVAKMILK